MSPAGTQRRGNWQASVKRHNGMAIASPFRRAMPRSLVDPDRPAVFCIRDMGHGLDRFRLRTFTVIFGTCRYLPYVPVSTAFPVSCRWTLFRYRRSFRHLSVWSRDSHVGGKCFGGCLVVTCAGCWNGIGCCCCSLPDHTLFQAGNQAA